MRRADIEVPNTAVDVDSWAVSACYPQGSFYPLSDGPSIRHHRITSTNFRSEGVLRDLHLPSRRADTVGALYRPGPMGADSHTNYALRKNGQQEIVPIHPELKEAAVDRKSVV